MKKYSVLVILIILAAWLLGAAHVYGADITVTNTNNSGAGSLRQAIIDATAGQTIGFAVTGTITLTSEISFSKNLTIIGPGATQLTLSGGGSNRVFNLTGGTIAVSGLTIANGFSNGSDGGGVYVTGTLAITFTNCVFQSNNSQNGTSGEGGGIYSNAATATMAFVGCTFSGNNGYYGGAISAYNNTATLTNCTVSGNTAGEGGAGIDGEGMTIVNCTITNNTGSTDTGGIFDEGGTTSIKNSIVALNTGGSSPDIQGGYSSGGYNIIGNKGGTTFTAASGDQVGTSGTPINPLLNALAFNGGTTRTHALQGSSPALNPASSNGAPSTDQRGYARNGNADIGSYEGAATEPEMNVTGLGNSISDGDTTPTATDNTDFGVVATGGGTASHTFTIANSGSTALAVYNVIVSGTNAADFTVTTQPASSVASGGGTTTFTILFTPAATGSRTATLTITNNDSSENPYNFDIQGTGIVLVSEMDMKQGVTAIADGGSHDFGSHALSSNTDIIFTIENSGTGNLTMTTPISIGGANADQFSIQAQPTSPVAASGSTTFTIRFTPTSTGAKTATISIANNDSNENPYDLTISGTGTSAEMDLKQGVTAIADGGSHGFNSQVLGSNTDVVFTIENSGSSNLTLTTPITIGGANADQFSIQAQPTSPVSASSSTTFTVRFTPTSAGAKTASISIANNDGNENPYDLTITGTGTAPEMDLKQGITAITDGGSHNFGNQLLSSDTDVVFTIENSGTANLTFTTPITIGGANADQFSIQGQPTSPVAGSGSTTFTVRFTPTSAGAKTATISIANNDSNENPYDLSITGTGTAPEMDLKQGVTAITDGSSYGFGNLAVSLDSDVVFTIENSGTANLTFTTPITIGGTNADQFSIQAQPSSPVAGSGSTTFTVRFSPTSTGAKTATISISNNDSNENPYDLTITGTGTAPEMDLKQGVTTIADGGSQDFASQVLSSNTDIVFTIENSGTGSLTFTTPISIGGANADQFSIQAQPTSPVAASGSTTFTVRFTPTSTGAKTATISIANNDSDENPYDLTITGTGTAPEMDLKQGVTAIVDGGSHNFGNQVLSSNTDVVFTIENSGTGNLTFTTPITIGGANADQFSIQAQPTSPLAGSGSTTFTVRFTPTSTGAKTATISIANNDSNENPYDLTITGTGTAPEMDLKQGVTAIADGGSHGFGSQTVSSNTDVVFTIENSGTANLTFTTPITIGGANADQFSIQAQPTSPVAGSGSTTFTVRFTPTSTGAKTATISIANNDSNENPYDLTITGTGTAPEMDLKQGVTAITDGGSYDFSSHLLSTNTDTVFTIENSGNANLTFTTPITIGGTNADQFSIQAQPTSPVAGSGSTTFTVRFTPTSTGAKTATISITNNDSNENPYDLTITGTGTAPEMALKQGATAIADGGSYDYTAQVINSNTDIVFTIENTGTGSLTLTTPITIGGTNADQFSFQGQPTTPVAASGSTTFTLRFTPTSTGLKTATISITNSDSDEDPYDLTITGTGTAPDMQVEGNGNVINDGDVSPSLTDHSDFGNTDITGGTVVRTFTIRNTGTADLTMNGTPKVQVIGIHAADFTVTLQPTSPVAASGTTTFQVSFDPSDMGVRNAAISIINNDADEDPYNFNIQGTGTSEPEMSVEGNAIEIVNGDVTPSLADNSDFGSLSLIGSTQVNTFTIKNTGSAALNLSGTPIILVTGSHAADFTVTTLPVSPVADSGGSTTFQVTFDPSAPGLRTATLSIANNDNNENPYTFVIQGNGQAGLPTVSTLAVSNITSSGAVSGGNITDNGGSTVSSRGVCWGTSANPTVAGSKTVNGSGNGAFTSTLTGLTEHTTYYVRAYATNSAGTAYGNSLLFKTNAEALSVTITKPKNGEEVSGTVTITAVTASHPTARDSVALAIAKVEFFHDGEKLATDTHEPYEVQWNTTSVPEGLHTLKVVAYNTKSDSSEQEITVFVMNTPAQIMVNRSRLNYGSVSSALTTGSQTLLINNVGGGSLNWSISKDASWLQLTATSGTGSGVVGVSVNVSGLNVGTYTASLTVSDPNATNSAVVVPVTLVVYNPGATVAPFGYFETPAEGASVHGSIPVTGWVLDDIEPTSVKIYRQPVSGEGSGLVYIGEAVFVDGARPDVEQTYPAYPKSYQAGWGYMLLTHFLPNQGNGTFTLVAKTVDKEGTEVTLGSKTIICNNADAIKPFGAIDTPTQGGTASGNQYVNFGWALTPLPNTIPVNGSTIKVWVDGVALGSPVYNQYRSDIATLFPGFNNSNGAVGYFYLNTNNYVNGVHTIAWSVKDNAGNEDGIGSRYFTVQNVGADSSAVSTLPDNATGPFIGAAALFSASSTAQPLYVFRGYDTSLLPETVYPEQNGVTTLYITENQRLEIRFDNPQDVAAFNSGKTTVPVTVAAAGYSLLATELRPLPVGSTLDRANGVFYWQPCPGFFGQYLLVFVSKTSEGQVMKRYVKVVISPTF